MNFGGKKREREEKTHQIIDCIFEKEVLPLPPKDSLLC